MNTTGKNLHGDESTPQRHDPVLLDCLGAAVDKAIVYLLVHGLIHQVGTDPVKRRDRARHEKAGNTTGCERGTDILSRPTGVFHTRSLGQIVDSHFGSIENTCAHNIGFNATVKSRNSLIFVHGPNHSGKGNSLVLVCLSQCLFFSREKRKRESVSHSTHSVHQRPNKSINSNDERIQILVYKVLYLQDVEWISDSTSDTTRDGTRQELHVERSILSSTQPVADGGIS